MSLPAMLITQHSGSILQRVLIHRSPASLPRTNTRAAMHSDQVHISSAFDAGNIEVIHCESTSAATDAHLSITPDPFCEVDGRRHFQWFYFQVSGAAGRSLTMHIKNAGESSYPSAWSGYKAVATNDMVNWYRVQDTAYDEAAGVLTIKHTPECNCVRYAYFAPYSLERHAELIMRIQATLVADHSPQVLVLRSHFWPPVWVAAQARPNVKLHRLGATLDGRDLHMLQVGTPSADKATIWVICRQHPGEPMAEWFAEGLLERLTGAPAAAAAAMNAAAAAAMNAAPAAAEGGGGADPEVQQLLERAVLYIVPNMNPDGSVRGHLRTNAAGANLNREWAGPSKTYSPEVAAVAEAIESTGLDMLLDVHGDEEIPANFIGSMFGVPAWGPRLERMQEAFVKALLSASPDFQTKLGYPLPPPNGANLSTASKANAQKYNTLSLVLEQPFKDTIDTPNEHTGWSPERAKAFGAAHVTALLNTVPTLLKERHTQGQQSVAAE